MIVRISTVVNICLLADLFFYALACRMKQRQQWTSSQISFCRLANEARCSFLDHINQIIDFFSFIVSLGSAEGGI
jgi:hypothetical protein